MKIPLEQANGGTLPNGSITFTNASVVEPEVPVDPLDAQLDAYFNNSLVATIDSKSLSNTVFGTNNSANISSAQHKDLTLEVYYRYMYSGFSELIVFVNCGDCRAKLPVSMNLVVDGNTYIGTSCMTGLTPYNESLSSFIRCGISGSNLSTLMPMGKNYQINFVK